MPLLAPCRRGPYHGPPRHESSAPLRPFRPGARFQGHRRSSAGDRHHAEASRGLSRLSQLHSVWLSPSASPGPTPAQEPDDVAPVDELEEIDGTACTGCHEESRAGSSIEADLEHSAHEGFGCLDCHPGPGHDAPPREGGPRRRRPGLPRLPRGRRGAVSGPRPGGHRLRRGHAAVQRLPRLPRHPALERQGLEDPSREPARHLRGVPRGPEPHQASRHPDRPPDPDLRDQRPRQGLAGAASTWPPPATTATRRGRAPTRSTRPGTPSRPSTTSTSPRPAGRCHKGVEADFWEGIHGQLVARGETDAPVCTTATASTGSSRRPIPAPPSRAHGWPRRPARRATSRRCSTRSTAFAPGA